MTKRGTVAGTAVVALGGNAIIPQGEAGTYAQQQAHAADMARSICELIDDGWQVVVVHGNGPQVGNLVIQQEAGRTDVPEMPLFALGAMTQGHLGSLIVLALSRALRGRRPVAALVSHVTVDPGDPAFGEPSKPIGPFLSEAQAAQVAAEHGYAVIADSGRGFRRAVASPLPYGLVEIESLRCLLDAGHVVVAEGGGGIPVVTSDDGWEGVDAVIDKDHAAAELAQRVGAEALVLVTSVEAVMVDFGSAAPRKLGRIDVNEAERHLLEGQFHAGSMGPKVSAATRFIRSGGRTAVITTARLAAATLRGADDAGTGLGTRIVAPASQREGAA